MRPNLKVISNAHAGRIIIERKTAVGVEFSAGPGKPVQSVYAKREVLLSGGRVPIAAIAAALRHRPGG